MDEFMSYILNALKVHGAAAVRIFPPPSRVLLAFADRVAVEVVRRPFLLSLPQLTLCLLGGRIHHTVTHRGEIHFQ